MRKLAAILTLVFLASSASAVEAVIDPGSPDDIVLDSGNSWEVSETYDASKSSGSGTLTYSWNWEEESKTDSGVEGTFTFNRDSSQTNTIKLTVSNGTHSDTTEVTQVIRDNPEVTENAGSDLDDIDIDDGEVTKTYSTSDFSISNTFDGPVSYSWDIESGEKTGSGSSIDYTFSDTDDKDVKLTVTDSEGYSGSDTIDVDVTNSSSGSSSNDNQQQTQNTQTTAGGGGNAESLASDFDEEDFLFSIDEGEIKEAEFEESPITKLSIGISQDVDKAVVIQSRESGERPDGADSDPSNEVYRFVELNPVNISDSDIENVTFEFQVNRSWVEDSRIADDSVRLMRYSDGWEELSTSRTGGSSDYFYYEAESSGFSVFAITGRKRAADFKVQKLDLNTTSIRPNETVRIDLEIKNVGDATGNYSFSFDLSGESFEKEFVNVPPGETRNASFVKRVDKEGSWDIKAGEKSATVDSSSATETGDKIENLDLGGGTTGIAGIAVLIVLILGVSGGVLLYTEKGDEIVPYIKEVKEELGIESERSSFSFDDYFGAEEEVEEEDGDLDYSFDWDEN